jgi:Protein of unknown function (DUF2778)
MTVSLGRRYGFAEYDHHNRLRNARLRRFAGAALLSIGFACAWTLWTNLAGGGGDQIAEPPSEAASSTHAKLPPRAVAYAKLAAALNKTRRSAASHIFASLFVPRPLGFVPGTFTRTAVEEADEPPPDALSLRLTNTKSANLVRGDRIAAPAQPPALAHSRTASADSTYASRSVVSAPTERPSIFERIFGKPASTTLAYAAPDDDGLGVGQGASGRYDRATAVYDISAHTVYLPDGTRLEAHSGFGAWLDDPRHTDERMRGATPATVYDLQPRESPFHGVQALRLIPLENDKVFGRTGLLAHTYMLGSNGQSNGCVSFRDYDAFLRAYVSGEIKRLAVVARLD